MLNEAAELLREVDTHRRRFASYGRFRPSGNSWLVDIPAHWEVMAVKHALAMPVTDGPHETPDFLSSGVPFISAEAIKNDAIDFSRKRGFISEEDHLRYSKKYLPMRGDVYMVKSGATTGNVARVDTDLEFNIWSPLAVFRPHPQRSTTDFIFYFMKSRPFMHSVELAWSYGTQQNIGMGVVSNLQMAVPPLDEQRAIAGFLDRETAKIDSLVAKKRRLIELLAEKRTALISHAVTKGLNPHAPTKPSGIDWLGDVPKHWEVMATKRVARLKTGHTPSRSTPEYWVDCTIPWFGLVDVWQIRDGRREYLGETSERISELGLANSAAELLPAGTVVVSRTASVGFSGIMPVAMATTQDFVNWVCGPRILPEYLLYAFRGMRQEFDRLTNGSVHKTIYMPDVYKFRTCVPPIEEQRAIVDFIRHERQKLDRLEDQVASVISKLNEYRSALISAAVTGQIDVRQEVAA